MGKYRVTETERGPAGAFVMQAASEDELRATLLRKNITPIRIERLDGPEETGSGGRAAGGVDPKLMEGMTPAERVRFMEAQAAYAHAKKPRTGAWGVTKIVLLAWWILSLISGVVGGLAVAADGDLSDDERGFGWGCVVLSIVLGVVTAALIMRAEAKRKA